MLLQLFVCEINAELLKTAEHDKLKISYKRMNLKTSIGGCFQYLQ